MKIDEIRGMNNEELGDQLESLKRKEFDLRCQKVTEKVEDTTLFKQVKRDIAKIKTIIREREIAAEQA